MVMLFECLRFELHKKQNKLRRKANLNQFNRFNSTIALHCNINDANDCCVLYKKFDMNVIRLMCHICCKLPHFQWCWYQTNHFVFIFFFHSISFVLFCFGCVCCFPIQSDLCSCIFIWISHNCTLRAQIPIQWGCTDWFYC